MNDIALEGTYKTETSIMKHFTIQYVRNQDYDSKLFIVKIEGIRDFLITHTEFDFFKTNVINKNIKWYVDGENDHLQGIWFNNNILVIIKDEEFDLFLKNKIKIIGQLSIDNDNIELVSNIQKLELELKFKYIINFSIDFSTSNINLLISKIEKLLLSNGIFYCYNASQLLISYMKEKINFKPYLLHH